MVRGSFFGTAVENSAAVSNAAFHPRRAPAARRRISPADGRALELLGHAIEYLADEYALSAAQTGTLDAAAPGIEAIQMLMALNRQIYYACPEIESVTRRIARWMLGMLAAPEQRPGGSNL